MKLYLNDKEKSIAFLNLMDLMLKGAMENNNLGILTPDSIKSIIKYNDPVLDFLTYYTKDASITWMNKATIDWLKNALYASKGSPQVLDILNTHFNLEIEYKYDPPLLDITQIKDLSVHDVMMFYTKFSTLIYYLLYYDELNIVIDNLIINLDDELNQKNYFSFKGFKNIKCNLDDAIDF